MGRPTEATQLLILAELVAIRAALAIQNEVEDLTAQVLPVPVDLFTVANQYSIGTLYVYVNDVSAAGNFAETDPLHGTFTFAPGSIPVVGDTVVAVYIKTP